MGNSEYDNLILRIMDECKEEGKQGRYLDFSVEEHYDCFCQMFHGEKKLKEEYPELYKRLLSAKADCLEKNAHLPSETDLKDDAYVCDIANIKECTHSFGAVSLTNKAETIYIKMTLYNNNVSIGSDFEFDSAKSRKMIGVTTEPQKEPANIRSVVHASWVPAGSDRLMSYAADSEMVFAGNSPVEEIDIFHPIKGVKEHTPESIPAPAPKRKTAETEEINQAEIPVYDEANINVCYNRSPSKGEVVDHKYPEKRLGGMQNVFLDVRGRVILKDKEFHSFSNVFLKLDTKTRGEIDYDSAINSDHFKECTVEVTEEGKKVTKHGFEFGFPTDWNAVIPSSVISSFEPCVLIGQIKFFCKDSSGTKDPTVYSIKFAGEPSFTPSKTYKQIDKIKLYWGCVHENCRILMADGSNKKAGTLRPDDLIRSASGKCSRIIDVITGHEPEMWNVKAENAASSLCVTQGHPIMTRGGYKAPEMLLAEDELLMEDGSYARLEYAYLCSMESRVINLILEEEHTFCADGYVVGDQPEQGRLASKSFKQEFPVQKELHQELKKMREEFKR